MQVSMYPIGFLTLTQCLRTRVALPSIFQFHCGNTMGEVIKMHFYMNYTKTWGKVDKRA